MILRAVLLLLAIWSGSGAAAAPERYRLDGSASRIEFLFDLDGSVFAGRVPVRQAEVLVDFADLAASRVTVVLDVAAVSSDVGLITAALKEVSVLDTGRHPQAVFVSRRVIPRGAGAARLEGDLTLKGVTLPVALDGAIFRRRGSDPGDLSDLVLIFEGSLSRSAFGAGGYGALVADEVGLRVLVAIVRE